MEGKNGIGIHKEFIGEFNDGGGSSFDASKFITKELVYLLRKQALDNTPPSQLLWFALDHIKKNGIDQSKSLIATKIASIFQAAFGLYTLDYKCICGWHVLYDKDSTAIPDSRMDHLLRRLIIKNIDVWMPLVTEYENEEV